MQEDYPEEQTRKGRPRSKKSHQAILKATNALLLHLSVQELSIEAIAKKAKVGKTTIYRWWPNKAALVMDALVHQPGMQGPMSTPKNNAEAILFQLEKLVRLLQSRSGETILQLFSEGQAAPEAQKILEAHFLGPLIDAIEYSVEQGQADGEFLPDLDPRMAVDMLCGPIFFRLMAHPLDFDERFQKTYPHQALQILRA